MTQDADERTILETATKRLQEMHREVTEQRGSGHIGVSIHYQNGQPKVVDREQHLRER